MGIQNEINASMTKKIVELQKDENILSIFLVGSMATNHYEEKQLNDYDIRFILKEMNYDTYNNILAVLNDVKDNLLKKNIACEVLPIIGPAKMDCTAEKNVLIHSIIMTEKELNELPNIHKLSYSLQYKNLYGKNVLKQYEKLVLKPKDVIYSTEGIDYCIDCIKNRKMKYSKWDEKGNILYLKQEEKDADDFEMIELFYYSYNKAVNNIYNMITTNNIKNTLSQYTKFTEEELKLIKKINMHNLVESDINDKSVRILIEILYKLEKGCLQIYKVRSTFYNSLEWGIIDRDSKEMRKTGFSFLKQLQLPTGDNFSMSYPEYLTKKEEINSNISDSQYIVIFEPPTNKIPRYGLTNVSSTSSIDQYIEQNKLEIQNYNVSFVEIIKELPDSYAGTVISDGQGNTAIEIIEGTCDSRKLTSQGADPNKTKYYRFDSFEDRREHVPSTLNEIRKICQFFKGYYEFAYGEIRNEKQIYFTYYSQNKNYTNIFRGGRTR